MFADSKDGSRARSVRTAITRVVVPIALTVSAGIGVSPASAAPHARGGWAGFGAKRGVWSAAHRAVTKDCPTASCFGVPIASHAQPYEFADVLYKRGRVIGYSQALSNATPLLAAELKVIRYMPPDTKTVSPVTIHHDSYGSSCAFVNVQSKTLSAWFGKKELSGNGIVGIEFLSLAAHGKSRYKPQSIDLALVVPTYLDNGDNC